MSKKRLSKTIFFTFTLMSFFSVFLTGCDIRPRQVKATMKIEDFQSKATVKDTEEIQALFKLLNVSPNKVTVSANKTIGTPSGKNSTVSYEIEVDGEEEKSGYYCMTKCNTDEEADKYIKIAKVLSEKEASQINLYNEPKGKLCKVLYNGRVDEIGITQEEEKLIPIDASRCKEYYVKTGSNFRRHEFHIDGVEQENYRIRIKNDICEIKNRNTGKIMCEIDLTAIRKDYTEKREVAEYIAYQDEGGDTGFHLVSGDWELKQKRQEADIRASISEKGVYFYYYSGIYRYNFAKEKFVKKLDGEKYPAVVKKLSDFKIDKDGTIYIMEYCKRKDGEPANRFVMILKEKL